MDGKETLFIVLENLSKPRRHTLYPEQTLKEKTVNAEFIYLTNRILTMLRMCGLVSASDAGLVRFCHRCPVRNLTIPDIPSTTSLKVQPWMMAARWSSSLKLRVLSRLRRTSGWKYPSLRLIRTSMFRCRIR